ncbi:MAG: sodium/sugar symporter [Lentimicrobiaceae bacterium]|jgi:SSS family solute:Na+ symporter|nr:sodium/sugar symporter [Lentimicrobiaceae bacterium]MDD4596764.1 sodium/sugar symporter [Lentimicrobiaceae bacterium]MDY0024478.1 sodium/sugar symporter [Lentimicrobium sp.]HAH59914.1 sodium/glucose cotransporter [Bacteroidales bacterium]
MGNFHTIDYLIFGAYALLILSVGLWVSRNKKGHKKNAEDYFLAGKSLPFWAIGASLIAANISAEQFIGMSGSGFAIGLAIASYEWMGAITLIIVAKFFLPVFIKQGLFTIPEFIEKRFNTNLKTILAVFWVGLFIFVNLTSVLFLGAKALDTIMGNGDGSMIFPLIVALALFAIAYSLWGGLSAVAWTDVIQVVLLVIGGLITTIIALNNVTPTGGVFAGLNHVYNFAGDKFHMILDRNHPEFSNLPGIGVIIGGLWVANLYYFGFNQYIIQRALAAKSLLEAQKGLAFAAFLKLLLPIFVVVPGIIAYVMFMQPEGTVIVDGVKEVFTRPDGSINYDVSYPWLIKTFIPVGLKGLVVAALTAAIVSSLASMLNSTATIFTMDIYKPYFSKKSNDSELVPVGRLSAVVALVIAVIIAPALSSMPQMFQYIQEYTGIVSPGILAVFLMGLFWKRANTKGAIIGILTSIPVALLLKLFPVQMPFLDQMMYTCLITIVVIVMVSLTTAIRDEDPKAIALPRELFKTDAKFNFAAYAVMIILIVLYTVFW